MEDNFSKKLRVFIIHGWGGHPNEHWAPWLQSELEKEGWAVEQPAMPNTDDPLIKEWVGHLRAVVGEVDEDTFFVGHSIGCQAVMRYLETISPKKVGGCVFVAGWFWLEDEIYNEGEEMLRLSKPWIETPIDFEKVRQAGKNFKVLISSDDPYNAVKKNREKFERDLGANVKILEKCGHFTGDDGVLELSEALQALRDLRTA